MLVLTRRPNETLIIGETGDIRLTILSLKYNEARIGIHAPKNIPIHREEIYQRLCQQNRFLLNRHLDYAMLNRIKDEKE